MKKLLLLFLLCPFIGFSQATTGYHRQNQVLAKAYGSLNAQVVPYATVVVTNAATGTAATIYSDPALSVPITGSTVTADGNGNYGYYIPLNYCVNENISAPGQGSSVVPNICQNTTAGSGTVLSGSSYKLPAYGNAASTTVGPSNITTDSMGNNLHVPGIATATTLTDGTASLSGGSLTGAVNGNFSGTLAVGTTGVVKDGIIPVNVRAFGATGNGTTDDSTAFCSAIAKAKSLGIYTMEVPNGTYLLSQNGILNCGLTTFTGAWHWIGQNRKNTILKFAPASTPSWFYDNCGGNITCTSGNSTQLTQNDLFEHMTFESSSSSEGDASYENTNVFRMYSTGTEQRVIFHDVAFVNLNTVLDAEGTANADRNVFLDCDFSYVNTAFLVNNSQSVGTQFIGSQGVFTGDMLQIGANGGGAIYWHGGSIEMNTTGTTMHYMVNNVAAATGGGLGGSNQDVVFDKARVEFDNAYGGIANYPYLYGNANVIFLGGNLFAVSGGLRTAIVLNAQKTVSFIGTVLSPSLGVQFVAGAGLQGSYANLGYVYAENCVTTPGWYSSLSSTNGAGRVTFRNCRSDAATGTVSPVDFDWNPFGGGNSNTVTPKYAILVPNVGSFPANGGTASVVLPANSIIKSITVHKGASGSNLSNFSVSLASSDGTTKVYGTCPVQVQHLAYDCDLDNIWYNVGTSSVTETVTLTAVGSGQDSNQTGFALVEYF